MKYNVKSKKLNLTTCVNVLRVIWASQKRYGNILKRLVITITKTNNYIVLRIGNNLCYAALEIC